MRKKIAAVLLASAFALSVPAAALGAEHHPPKFGVHEPFFERRRLVVTVPSRFAWKAALFGEILRGRCRSRTSRS